MSTVFKGRKNGFFRHGDDVTPNFMGPPETTFKGRGPFPKGEQFNRFPGEVANADVGNRRLAKSKHSNGGEGMNDGVMYKGAPSGFKNSGASMKASPGMKGRSAMKDNKK